MKREMQTKYIPLLIVICEWKGRDLNSLEDKTIFIEEFSMVQNKWMTLIYKALTMFNNKIFMFGDPNQCEPVESNSQRRYNFLESKTVNEMCPKRKNLEYIESGCRYDIKIHEMSDKFLKTGQISTYFNYKYYKNLCYLHSTRIKDNTGCCDRFVKKICEVNAIACFWTERYTRLLSVTGVCALVQPVEGSKHDSNGTCQTKIASFTNIKTRIKKSN